MNDFEKFNHYIGGGSKGNLKYDIYSTDDENKYYYVLFVSGSKVYNSLENGETYNKGEIDDVARSKAEEYLRRVKI